MTIPVTVRRRFPQSIAKDSEQLSLRISVAQRAQIARNGFNPLAGSSRARNAERRRRAYAKGREDARRTPLGELDRKIARHLALDGYYNDQHRAYWLGVMREVRS